MISVFSRCNTRCGSYLPKAAFLLRFPAFRFTNLTLPKHVGSNNDIAKCLQKANLLRLSFVFAAFFRLFFAFKVGIEIFLASPDCRLDLTLTAADKSTVLAAEFVSDRTIRSLELKCRLCRLWSKSFGFDPCNATSLLQTISNEFIKHINANSGIYCIIRRSISPFKTKRLGSHRVFLR